MKKLSSLPLPALILMLGGLLRITGVNASAIWLDEAITAYTSRLPVDTMLLRGVILNQPLWYVLLRPFAHGPVWLLRLPALVSALVSLYLFWRLMQILALSPLQQTIGALIAAFLPGLLWQAQDARAYAFLSLLYLLGFMAALDGRILRLGVIAVLMVALHKMAPILIVTLLLIVWLRHPQTRWQLIAVACVSGGAYLLGMWRALFDLQQVNDLFWSAPLTADWALQQIDLTLFAGSLDVRAQILFWAFAALPLFVWLFLRARDYGAVCFLWLPLILLFAVSLHVNIFYYRPLSVFLFPFALLVAESAPQKTWARAAYSAATLLILGASLWGWNPAARGAGLDHASDYIRAHWQAGDILHYAGTSAAFTFDYYLHDLPHALVAADYPPAVLPVEYEALFDFEKRSVGDIAEDETLQRIWFIWPREPLFDDDLNRQFAEIAAQGTLIARLDYLQAADVEIYLVAR